MYGKSNMTKIHCQELTCINWFDVSVLNSKMTFPADSSGYISWVFSLHVLFLHINEEQLPI